MGKQGTRRMRWRHHEVSWRPCLAAVPSRPPTWVRELIGERGSLTERLERLGNVEVTLLRQGMSRPSVGEAVALGMDPRQWAWLREVVLDCDAGLRVYARSVIPGRVTGPLAALPRLGTRPLGRLIFAAPDAQRGPVVVAQLRGGEQLALRLYEYGERSIENAWTRRSTLMVGHQRILVTEVFLTTSGREEAEGELASR